MPEAIGPVEGTPARHLNEIGFEIPVARAHSYRVQAGGDKHEVHTDFAALTLQQQGYPFELRVLTPEQALELETTRHLSRYASRFHRKSSRLEPQSRGAWVV